MYFLALKDARPRLPFLQYRCPDNAKIRQKMLYTSSKDGLKRALTGVGKEVQACDQTELAWTRVIDVLIRAERLQKQHVYKLH